MDVVIVRVRDVNDNLLAALEHLIPQLTKAPIPSRLELQRLLDSESVLLVAHQGSETGPIVGMGTLGIFRTPSGLHAHIEDVVVDESLRGKGLGELLVRRLLDEAREIGLQGVSLTCNPRRVAANRLYQKMGFKPWATNVYWYEL